MSNKLVRFAVALFVLCLLNACASPKPERTPLPTPPQSPLKPSAGLSGSYQPEPPPAGAPIPTQGKASISGLVYSYTSGQTVLKTLFYLTPAVGPDKTQMPALLVGPEASNGDLQGETDEHGQITLNDIPPGNYYLIVWAPPYSWSEAQLSADDHAPRLIKLSPKQSLPLGIVYVSWP